jgi:predicted enzyme involved in methoxymalonyl-ACP biosynthesis
VSVRDRFGDYGLVGAIIYRGNQDAIELDSMLLSCRALGRRVEHRMLAHVGQAARERGIQRVRIRFVPTAKNRPAREFLDSIGAALDRGQGSALLWETPAETLEALHVENRQSSGYEEAKSGVSPAGSAAVVQL